MKIEHAFDLSSACTTCRVIVREGFNDVNEGSKDEEDLLETICRRATPSRLSCKTIPACGDSTVESPNFSFNQVSEDQ